MKNIANVQFRKRLKMTTTMTRNLAILTQQEQQTARILTPFFNPLVEVTFCCLTIME